MNFRTGLALAALLLTGCPNPNTYGTPRTVAPGKISHSIAAEWVGWRFDVRSPSDSTDPDAQEVKVTESTSIIVPPTYTLRLGLADQVDLGFRAANMTSLGADVKYNFLRGDTIDLAVDPGVQWLFVGFSVYHVHVPLLVGINLSDQVTLVLTPGVMYGISSFSSGNDAVDTQIDQLLSTAGLYGRAGIGVNLRVSPRFAIQPELTFLRSFKDDRDSLVSSAMTYMFGVGFNFGNLPEYGVGPTE